MLQKDRLQVFLQVVGYNSTMTEMATVRDFEVLSDKFNMVKFCA
jgi:hypothetical protein